MANSIEIQLKDILEDYSKEVQDTIAKEARGVARDAAKELKNTSPKKSGDYASGWTSKMTDEKTAIVFNRKKPQLTHLLENGHRVVNKKGEYGRVRGIKHIEPVADQAEDQFVERIERDLS